LPDFQGFTKQAKRLKKVGAQQTYFFGNHLLTTPGHGAGTQKVNFIF
jgi:hypothetical protein